MISKLNIFLIVVLAVLLMSVRTDAASNNTLLATIPFVSADPTATPTSTPTPTPTIPLPQTLTIPKLNIQTPIEEAGVNIEGYMELVPDSFKVGWNSLGPKPGEKGNAVLAGHLDLTTGAPGIFFWLRNLTAGDEVDVTDATGHTRSFIVVDKQTYLQEEIPENLVFGQSDNHNLNLITCAGIWNQQTHLYSHRLVVFTTLKQ